MPKGVVAAKGDFDFNLLRDDLSQFLSRRESGNRPWRGIRNLAKELEIPASTLSKFMGGGGHLRTQTLFQILSKLGKPMDRYSKQHQEALVSSGEDTMTAIEKHLKRDKTLTPKKRRILSNLLNSSYRYTVEVLRAARPCHL